MSSRCTRCGREMVRRSLCGSRVCPAGCTLATARTSGETLPLEGSGVIAPYGLVDVRSADGKSGYLVPPEAVPMAREVLRAHRAGCPCIDCLPAEEQAKMDRDFRDAVDRRRNLIEHAERMMGEK